MGINMNKIEAFIEFFKKNEEEIYEIQDGNEVIFEKLYQKLQNIDVGLSFEISPEEENQKRKFILSANGVLALIPIVEEIHDAFYPSDRFEFIKFRQKKEIPEDITYNDKKINATDIFFELFEWEDGKIDLNIYVKNFDESDDMINICFLYLDVILWEYSVMTKIGGIEFYPLDQIQKSDVLWGEDFSYVMEKLFVIE